MRNIELTIGKAAVLKIVYAAEVPIKPASRHYRFAFWVVCKLWGHTLAPRTPSITLVDCV
jgi:hypothetical protein